MLKYIVDGEKKDMPSAPIAEMDYLVSQVKDRAEVTKNYMKKWDYELHLRRDITEEVTQQITERINNLHKKLIDDGRLDDLTKAVTDKDYQQKLFEEYNL